MYKRKYVRGNGYRTIFKQLDVPVTTVAHIILVIAPKSRYISIRLQHPLLSKVDFMGDDQGGQHR